MDAASTPRPSARVRRVPEYTSGQLPSEQQTTGPTDVPSDAASQAPRDLRRDDLLTGADDTEADAGHRPGRADHAGGRAAARRARAAAPAAARLPASSAARGTVAGGGRRGRGRVGGGAGHRARPRPRLGRRRLAAPTGDGPARRRCAERSAACRADVPGPRLPGSGAGSGSGRGRSAGEPTLSEARGAGRGSRRWSVTGGAAGGATPGGGSARLRRPRPWRERRGGQSPPWSARPHPRPDVGPTWLPASLWRVRTGQRPAARRRTRPPPSVSTMRLCGPPLGIRGGQRSPSRRRRHRSSKRSIIDPEGGC